MARLKSAIYDLAVALGFTTICITFLLEPLVAPDHSVVYHWSGSLGALFGPTAIFGAGILVVMLLVLISARRPGRWRAMVWSGIVVLLPWILWRTMAITWPGRIPEFVAMPRAVWGACLWVLLVLLWRPSTASRYEQGIKILSTVLVFVALSGVLSISQYLWFWWQAHGVNAPRPAEPAKLVAGAAQTPRHRIIWLVLDELSYQQVYERRYPGLELPAFDALASTATVFTHVAPAGIQTDRVLPELMSGVPVDDIRSSAKGELSVHNPVDKRWERFDQRNTVFQDARNLGYETGVAGWFNPYCRIMSGVLDHCLWRFGQILQNGLTTDGTLRGNLAGAADAFLRNGPVAGLLVRRLGLEPGYQHVLDLQRGDFLAISAFGDKLLADPSVNFLLIHLPVPHPPGFFDRRTGKFSSDFTTYIDNLALADRVVAHVRQTLQQQGEWDSSAVIVMGDHSWRTKLLWEKAPTWTAEEQEASGGGAFDDRPGYIVKMPGQTAGRRIDEPYPAMRTRALLDGLLTGEIGSADDLERWVQDPAALRSGEETAKTGGG